MDIYWPTFFFLLMSAIACGFALAVVFTGNIVRMAFFLTISLGATAGLFFLAGADFVGAMQLLIYVGGTLVLLIFGVMLTAQGPFITMKTRPGEWILAGILGGTLLAVLVQTAFSIPDWRGVERSMAEARRLPDPTATKLGLALEGVRVDHLEVEDETERSGRAGYLLPFEIVSIHLLVVLVGAAYLARASKRREQGG